MTAFVPNYYKNFKCIADKCQHSCCIGWEIDIDEDTLEFYEALDGKKERYIKESISYDDTPHFALKNGNRCPHLMQNGLCRIICDFGESAICDICADHPRFRNFYENFTEEGLGLCCEEAARIILSESDPFCILGDFGNATDEEKIFFSIRDNIFKILQQRDKSIKERFCGLAQEYGFEFSFSLEKLCEDYLSLERLDDNWTDILNELKEYPFDGRIFEDERFLIPLENLACYLIFRHLADAMYDGQYAAVVKFAVSACYLLGALWQKNGDIAEAARMFSSEVEYSEENMKKILTAA